MPRRITKPVWILLSGGLLGIGLFLGVDAACAQNTTVDNRHVEVHTHGGTPLSYQIQAEAAYASSYGDAVKSIAEARKINAEAVALEIENSVSYVEAYFKRREINREEWKKAHPNAMAVEEKHQQVLKEKVQKQYQDLLRGDVTQPLNWLLRELSGPVVACQYLPAKDSLANSPFDQRLNRRDLEQIVLTDGGTKGSHLNFHASDGEALQIHWPQGMNASEFDQAKADFENARNALVEEIKEKHQVSNQSQERIIQSVNAVFVALDNAYPQEKRKDPTVFSTYSRAKSFTTNLLAQVRRACSSNSAAYFLGGGMRFEGDTVVGLLQHMYRNGLEFAPPEPGGEGVYKTLFQGMRTLYLDVGQEQAANGRQL
jgi:hypothetical protein